MKRIFYFGLAAMVSMAAATNLAGAQSQTSSSPTSSSQTSSLGDYARKVKKTQAPGKSSPKVYDNDNLPTGSSVSVVGQTPDPDAKPGKDSDAQGKDGEKAADGSATAEKSGATGKDENGLKPGQTPAEHEKALTAWKARLEDQKSKIDLASRELDVLQREYKLKTSDYYNNAALRAQNPNFLMPDDAKYTKQIADKQKDVDAAKAKLADMQDEARKSGAPNSVIE